MEYATGARGTGCTVHGLFVTCVCVCLCASVYTDRAASLLQQCLPVLDVPHAADKIWLGQRVGAVPDQDPRTRSGVGWVLLKYLSLMVGQGRMKLESVVDDFLIHLLVALGYNDGDLVVL